MARASSWTATRTREGRSADLAAGSRVSAWVIPTNEELMIARHTQRLIAHRLPGSTSQARYLDMHEEGDEHVGQS